MSYGTAPIDYPPDRQRRSSILIPSIPSSPFTGVNSLGRFASSFQRAQSFLNLDPPQGLNRERTYFDDDEFSPYRRGDHTGDDESVFDESDFLDEPSFAYTESVQPRSRLDSLVSQDAPLLVKRVENADGTIVTSVEGQSTAPRPSSTLSTCLLALVSCLYLLVSNTPDGVSEWFCFWHLHIPHTTPPNFWRNAWIRILLWSPTQISVTLPLDPRLECSSRFSSLLNWWLHVFPWWFCLQIHSTPWCHK